ncbi:MAG: helix-turn-helix transcriptional regulator [Chthoniobacteraceae bacterium]
MSNEQLISLAEAGRILKVCVRTVRREIQRGKLPPIKKVGRACRLPLSGVQQYIASL